MYDIFRQHGPRELQVANTIWSGLQGEKNGSVSIWGRGDQQVVVRSIISPKLLKYFKNNIYNKVQVK